jgi:RNA polymerase sigma factor (sigma-70 family)
MSEDTELLRRYVDENSQPAFAELVSRRIGLVYAIAWRRTRDAHFAHDVTQAVFTALARKAPQLVRHQTLVGWLYRSAHFAASDAVRATRRQQRREEEALAMQEINRGAAEPDWQQLSPVVDQALSEMSAVDRDAVLLRVVDGRSYGEIGRNFGMGESGARMRVERALEKMRHILMRRGVTSTAAALTAAIGHQAGAAVPAALASTVAATAVSAAANAGGIAALLSFMSITPVMITTVGVAALAAATGTAVYQAREAERGQKAVVSISRERDQFAAQLTTLRGQLAQADQLAVEQQGKIAKIEAALETARTAAPARNAPNPTPLSGSGANPAEEARLAAVAQEVAARRDARDKISPTRVPMAALETTYQALYRQLHLNEDQIAAFKALATENAKRHTEIDQLAVAQGLKVSDPSMAPLYRQADADFDGKVATSLGSDGQRTFQHFADTMWIRSATDTLARALFYSEAPLTANQADQLVNVVWDNMRSPTGGHNTDSANFDAMAIQAQPILSAPQLPVWQRMMSDWKTSAKNRATGSR